MSREHVISVRLTEDEYNRLKQQADKTGETLSQVLRRLIDFREYAVRPGIVWEPPSPGWNKVTCTRTAPLNPIMWNVPAGAHADGQTLTISY